MSACSCLVRLLVSSCLVAQLLACSDSAETIAVDQSSSVTKSSRAEVGAEVTEQATFSENVTVAHQSGETLVPLSPERVVVLGAHEEDSLIALGLIPVAVTRSRPATELFPSVWSRRVLGETQIIDLGELERGLDYKRLAELRPDLVLAMKAELSRSEYEAISSVAATVASPRDSDQPELSWQEHVEFLGQVLSRDAEAGQAILVAQASIFDAIRPHPSLKGSSFAWLKADREDAIRVAGGNIPSSRFLKQLGLVYPSDLDDEIGNEGWVLLTEQMVNLLDVDVLLVETESPLTDALIESSLLGAVPAVQQQKTVWLERGTALHAALNTVTILSLDLLLDELVPKISDVVTVVLDPPTAEELLAMEAFRLVYGSETKWSEKKRHLENAGELRIANEAYRAGAADNGGITLRPKAAEIVNDSARIIYDVYFGDSAAYTDLDRTVYLIDGLWTVTEKDYCGFLSAAQVPCSE